jgi:hypothetical protein
MMEVARALGINVIAIVTPYATSAFAEQHPDALQQMLPAEHAIADLVGKLDWEPYTIQSHRWFPLVQMSPTLCFEHPAARAELQDRVTEALTLADGVAFDGFGFLNHYACFCQGCQAIRQQRQMENPARHPAELMAQQAEASLVDISHCLHRHAKSIKANAIVTNHLWPPFRPNPYYGCRLKLDYCSQTISWFYKPNWSLPRVEFEAQEIKRLEEPENNRFVPFLGMFDDVYLVRQPARVTQELAIAKRYGEGHLVFCDLQVLQTYPAVGEVVKTALSN